MKWQKIQIIIIKLINNLKIRVSRNILQIIMEEIVIIILVS